MVKVIHKRMIDTSPNGDHTYQLCEPHIQFSTPGYTYLNVKFKVWEMTAKYVWKYITCKKCLWLGHKLPADSVYQTN